MTRNETFNGLRIFDIPGHYFELLTTVSAVDLKLIGPDGDTVADERGVTAGYFLDRRGKGGFSRIEITTGANEAVKFMATDGAGGNRSLPASLTSSVAAVGAAHTPASKTAGAATSQMLAANASRHYLLVQNQSATDNAFINTGGNAAVADGTCIKLAPGDVYEPWVAPVGAINMIRGGAVDVTLHVIEA
jgi:hypothetical protein